ncbi:MAG: hypothetical protein CSA21_00700 [Deltaproteobacteria bacterium]|nr:MAG: hypothetical protein CSA21_00700 [Deltaproteobacteria bacterium]
MMAAQALPVSWEGKLVIDQSAVFKWQMTGGTSCTVADKGVVITLVMEVAAQAAAPEQVIGQVKRGNGRLVEGYFSKRGKGCRCAEMIPYKVDLVRQGEVQGCRYSPGLVGMTLTTGVLQMVRVCWLPDDPLMRHLHILTKRVTPVTGGAEEVMFRIELHGLVATPAASGHHAAFRLSGRGNLGGGHLRWLIATPKVEEKKAGKRQENRVHNLDILP